LFYISVPPANIIESDKDYKLELSVPGFKKEDFNIDIDQGTLVISSERKEESNKEEKNYSRKEFSYSSSPVPFNYLKIRMKTASMQNMIMVCCN
jgi:HSP20 family molecular chaperone IbpA